MSSNTRSTLPRRTQEFEMSAPSSSVKKAQGRVSRLAQPVRKTLLGSAKASVGQLGENGRSRSMDKGINSLALPTTASKKTLNPRSSSATPLLRTPLRSMSHTLNVENMYAQAPVPSTVERERCSAEARKIFDYLAQANIPDLPKEFIERSSIKAMSMRQFLLIVAHLFRQIGGSRYKIGANFVEDIMKAITELQYPYTVNKSMLKTPSAPHSISQVTTMLSWLIDLSPPPNKSPQLTMKYLHAPEFPSQEYTQYFFQSAIESFHLWNHKREEEFGQKIEEMVDRLVACKTNGLNQAQVRERTKELQKQLEEIGTNSTDCNARKESCDGVEREVAERKRLLQQLTVESKRLAKELECLEREYHQREDQYYDLETEVHKLKKELATQAMTVEERDELRNLITCNKSLLAAKRKAVASLEEQSADYQITLSRMIKQKISYISQLNTMLCNLSNTLKPDIQFEPIELSLTSENYPALEQTLKALEQQLKDVFAQYHELRGRLSQEKCRLEQQLSDLNIKIQPLEAKLASQQARLERLLQERDELGREMAALALRADEEDNWKEQEKQMEQQAEKLKQELQTHKKAIEKLAHSKRQLMEDGLERCREALAERQQKLDSFRAHVEGCEAIMQTLTDACKREATDELAVHSD